jgi:dethiobiotin synthetase
VRAKLIYITGTGTDVGKTVVTSLLLTHLRQNGARAMAIKPFCSGGRQDAELLHALQENDLTLDEVNPFHFEAPVAPLVAAREAGRAVPMSAVIGKIRQIQKRCDWLLIEGAGGLLSPLGEAWWDKRGRPLPGAKLKPGTSQLEKYCAVELIMSLKCQVLVCSLNALGTINHTLMTVLQLLEVEVEPSAILLRPPLRVDASTSSNPGLLEEFCGFGKVFSLPKFTKSISTPAGVKKAARESQPLLKQIENKLFIRH